VNSYKNNCTWIREGLQWEEIGKAKAQKISVNAAIHTVTDVDDTELIDSKAWLVTNRDKENLLMHWELCYEQRRKEINSNKFKGITEIFEDWPVLKENIGCELIEIDFEKLFGTINFAAQWENYFKKTVKFFQKKSKNLIIEELELLDQPNLSEGKC
ncbi:GSCOCG00011213001-RA-CDS, partial [Cotesia congregata]